MAAKGEALRLCKCGDPVNVAELREQSQAEAESIHLTKTPAGMSQWLKGKLRVRGQPQADQQLAQPGQTPQLETRR